MNYPLHLAVYTQKDQEEVTIFLVNNSHLDFEYSVLTGAVSSDEDTLIETNQVLRENNFIKAFSTEVFEKTDVYEFDFTIWYEANFFASGGAIKLLLSASLPKYDVFDETKYQPIKFTDKKGLLVPLLSRGEEKPIQKLLFDVKKISSKEIYETMVKFFQIEERNKPSSPLIQKATKFAYKVHQLDQFQTRKGKSIPYITHPLNVGSILERVGSSDEIIAAGILHDTLEDSTDDKKITKEMLEKEFGAEVVRMVNDVTEQDKRLPWPERKKQALEHISQMQNDSLLVKTADVISNLSEQIDDFKVEGEKTWERFNAPKEAQLERYQNLVRTLNEKWPENPLLPDLKELVGKLDSLI